MKNANYHSRDVKKCCENKLSVTFRSGKEFNGWVEHENEKLARITIPKGRKPIPRKTYKAMAEQLKLKVSDFDDLLDCTMTYQDYISLIQGETSLPT